MRTWSGQGRTHPFAHQLARCRCYDVFLEAPCFHASSERCTTARASTCMLSWTCSTVATLWMASMSIAGSGASRAAHRNPNVVAVVRGGPARPTDACRAGSCGTWPRRCHKPSRTCPPQLPDSSVASGPCGCLCSVSGACAPNHPPRCQGQDGYVHSILTESATAHDHPPAHPHTYSCTLKIKRQPIWIWVVPRVRTSCRTGPTLETLQSRWASGQVGSSGEADGLVGGMWARGLDFSTLSAHS